MSSSIAWTPLVRPTPRSVPCAFSSWLSRADHLTNRPRRYSNQVSTGPRVVSSELIVQLCPLPRHRSHVECTGDLLSSALLSLEPPLKVLEVLRSLVPDQYQSLPVLLRCLVLQDILDPVSNLRAVSQVEGLDVSLLVRPLHSSKRNRRPALPFIG